MGYSYQDIDQRLKVIEAKVDFALKAIPVAARKSPLDPNVYRMTLLDLYLLQNALGDGNPPPLEEPTNAPDDAAPSIIV